MPVAAAQVPELTVEGMTLLNVARLKEELKRRGCSIAGKKGDLQARLKEVIVLNVPVASGVVARHASCRRRSSASTPTRHGAQ